MNFVRINSTYIIAIPGYIDRNISKSADEIDGKLIFNYGVA